MINTETFECEGQNWFPEVSVILVTYNQEFERIAKTLKSIVLQEDITFEIIICDDGSEKLYENELTTFFSEKAFSHYEYVFHTSNEGTVLNYYSGLKKAKGKYSKLLSPGDYLVGRKTLHDWVRYMEERNSLWSFSDTIFYKNSNEGSRFLRLKAKPQVIRPYVRNELDKCIWNYLVLNDMANGASILGVTYYQKHYCEIIKDKGVKYCEDYIYRLMMFHGNNGVYFPKSAVCYEYGKGISSSESSYWKNKMLLDRKRLIEILLEERDNSAFCSKIVRGVIRKNRAKRFRKMIIKGYLGLWLKNRFFPRRTIVPKEIGE